MSEVDVFPFFGKTKKKKKKKTLSNLSFITLTIISVIKDKFDRVSQS